MTAISLAHTIVGVDSLPIEEFKEHVVSLVNQVRDRREKFTVISENRPSAVVVSVAEWESIMETMSVLSDPELMSDLKEAEAAEARGESYSLEEVMTEFGERRSR